ncbi:MAG: hypothetical protein JKY48_05815 [Flavobacteriales bacterium]|nr:hypothetical protein [Flavobacteriales bacterium]
MKNLSKLFLTLLICSLSLISFEAKSQIISVNPCNSWQGVAKDCVGSCGLNSSMGYQGVCSGPSLMTNYCITNVGSNLCPSHEVLTTVFANGAIVASGNLTAVGSSLSFSAPCNSFIYVYDQASYIGGINCIQLGQAYLKLRKQ